MRKMTSSFFLLFFIGLLPVIIVLGNSMFLPVLPKIEEQLALSSFETGLVLTIFSIPAALLIPFSGFLSEMFNKRLVLTASLVMLLVGCVLSSLSAFAWINQTDLVLTVLLGGRFLQGIGAGGVAPLGMMYASQLFNGTRRNQALGTLEVFNGTAKIISPIIGGLLIATAWTYSFVVYFAFGLLALAGMLILTDKNEKKQERKASFMKSFRQSMGVMAAQWKWIVPIYAISGLGMFVLFGLLFFLSYDLETRFSIEGLQKGGILTLPFVSLAVTSYAGSRWMKLKGTGYKREMFLGILMMTAGAAVLTLFAGLLGILAGLILLASGLGLFLPAASATIAAVIEEDKQAMLYSYYSMVRFLGVALGPILYSGWMREKEQMMVTTLGLMCIALLLTLLAWSCIPVFKNCENE